MIKKLGKSIREYKKDMYWTFALMIGEAILEALIPFLAADLVNNIKAGVPIGAVIKTGILLVIMAAASLGCGAIAGFTSSRASAGFAKNLRRDVFEKTGKFAFENIDKFSSSSLVTRMTTDINNIQFAYMMIIRTAVRSPLMIIFCTFMAFYMGGKLAFSFLVAIPILGACLFLVARAAMPAFKRVFHKYDVLNNSIEENVQAARVVKGFAREEYEKKKFDIAAVDICSDFTRAERTVAINMPVMSLCMYINMIFILYMGAKLDITSMGSLVGVGQISAMITYGVQILISLMFFSLIFVIVTMSAESGRRVCEILDEEPGIEDPAEPIFQVPDGSIAYKNVCFRYSSRATENALDHINLEIPSGATVGIIGGTGSSKSTLVQLIPRLYDVTEGSVEVGGIDVRKYSMEALREEVAMVLQKNQLFAGTIKDNLKWGDPNATDEEIRHACQMAQAEEFILTFKEGYDTWIEQGGTNVSGGQKQRLCIARALLKKPRILILDDSTSAVDTKTDSLIREAFRSYIPETTKLIIAQRINSVMDADMIVVMDKGQIVSIGTHNELMATSQIYREVYEEQVNGGDKDDK